MEFDKLLSELKKLNLPKGKYAIFGSGPLAIRGLRDTNDLDVLVKSDIFEELKVKYPQDISKHPCNCLVIGNIEIGETWQGDSDKVNEMIDNAEEINGFSFVKLDYVIGWKKQRGTEKNKRDLELIEEFLRISHHGPI